MARKARPRTSHCVSWGASHEASLPWVPYNQVGHGAREPFGFGLVLHGMLQASKRVLGAPCCLGLV